MQDSLKFYKPQPPKAAKESRMFYNSYHRRAWCFFPGEDRVEQEIG